MKICAIICEFNPFHNGHKRLLEEARRLSGCDKLLCIMSGGFTQRGDIAVFDKFTRARHAVICGADCVIELPAAFSISPAEIFAKGAIKILSAISDVKCLAFGCETPEKDKFIIAAKAALNESADFKAELSKNLESGESYIKSYCAALEKTCNVCGFFDKPNNILGLEYTKAILNFNSDIQILPVKRLGGEFSDNEIRGNYSSAGAIRKNIFSPQVESNVPPCVFADLKNAAGSEKFEWQTRYDLVRADAEKLKGILGCSEGLENRLIGAAKEGDFADIIEKCTSKRYSSSRIKRIMCANSLEIYESEVKEFLQSSLYIKPLAVKKEGADEMLATLSRSDFPVIIRGRDCEKLSPTAKKCFKLDEKTFLLYKLFTDSNACDNLIFI